MKSNLIMALLLVSALNSGFAAAAPVTVSTLAQREEIIIKALEKGPKDGLEAINKAQEGELKVDDANYIVVIEKDGDAYKRVAHFKKDNLNQPVEANLLNVVQEAEAKLAGSSGPIAFSFSANDKKTHAVLSKQGNLLIFNICPTQEEVDAFLKPAAKVELEATKVIASPESPKVETATVTATQEKKPVEDTVTTPTPSTTESKADKAAADAPKA